MQWGVKANKTESYIRISFPIAFKTKNYSFVVSDWSSPDDNPFVKAVGAYYTTRQLSMIRVNFQDNKPRGFGWIALGY